MKKIIGIFIFMLLIFNTLPALGIVYQKSVNIDINKEIKPLPDEEKWVKTYGGIQEDECKSVMQTSDGGYILVGETRSFGNGYSNLWLIKTDNHGNKIWDKIFGGNDHDYGESVRQTSDGGYIIAGVTRSYSSSQDYSNLWVIKTDSNGTIAWELVGDYGYERGFDVIETSDGGYVVVGDGKRDKDPDGSDAFLLKTDKDGNILWGKFYDYDSHDHAFSVEETTEGGFIICGDAYSYDTLGYYIWLIKTDFTGEMEWNKTYDLENSGRGHEVHQIKDGGYILVGYKNVEFKNTDIWVIKTDSEGNKEWYTILGGDGYDEGHSIIETNDGGFVIAGFKTKFAYYDALLAKLDSDGNEIWTKIIGGFGPEAIYSAQQTSDGGFILGGYKIAGTKCDVLLIKTDANGDIPYNYNSYLSKSNSDYLFSRFFRVLQILNIGK